ncbi:hypothetical protein [Halorubrum sp. CBA1229]|uniref:hypothetical protein n=1 Tax=Halorubrum sp. CBA1229 TaxID=1853699 RepID=UPI000F3B256E|nr:hypothetical protein [Halorubrum sp. CBA1229]QKY17153.1 hypothetical protein Hrr1229_009735 [Halorubrum sp. CBA1229]
MQRVALLGGGLLIVGLSIVLAQLVTFPAMLFGGCTDVGVPDGEGQGIGVLGVADGNLLYTPDGVNECSIPLPAVGIPAGLIAVGIGSILSQRVTRN